MLYLVNVGYLLLSKQRKWATQCHWSIMCFLVKKKKKRKKKRNKHLDWFELFVFSTIISIQIFQINCLQWVGHNHKNAHFWGVNLHCSATGSTETCAYKMHKAPHQEWCDTWLSCHMIIHAQLRCNSIVLDLLWRHSIVWYLKVQSSCVTSQNPSVHLSV